MKKLLKHKKGIPIVKYVVIAALFIAFKAHALSPIIETGLSQIAYSQVSSTIDENYEHIVDTNKMWVVFYNHSYDPPSVGVTGALKIKDSILLDDGLYWFKVIESFDSTYSNWSLRGYIRELNKIVVYRDYRYDRIDTIYNFNKTISDTLVNMDYDCNIYIKDTATINFANKKRFSQIVEGHHYITLKHIEGIGSNAGLIDPYWYCSTGTYRYLVCYYYNDELQFLDPDFGKCYINEGSNKVNTQESLACKIYPNPSQGKYTIEIKKNKLLDMELQIYNMMGIKIKSMRINEQLLEINLSEFENGFFIFKITQQNKFLKSGIIIKN